jgi:hypothetical protein
MPQRDTFHALVRRALEKDGWTVTHDPLVLPYGLHRLYVDLGAEQVLAAERGTDRIAVEIKSFVGRSEIVDLEQAVGQFMLYRSILQRREPDRQLVLAVSADVFDTLMDSDLGRIVREDYAVAMLVFDSEREEVTRWLR